MSFWFILFVNNSFQKGVVPHEKKTRVFYEFIYPIMDLYMTWENGNPCAHKKRAKSPILVQIDGFCLPMRE